VPNGDDKNWVRICSAVDGFRGRYERWPTGVRLPPNSFEDVVGHVLTPAGFALVSNIFAIISDEALSERVAIIAVGEDGAEFRYGEGEHGEHEVDPLTWAYFGSAVLREGLGCGLEYVTIRDAEGNVVWAGEGAQEAPSQANTEEKSEPMQLSDYLSQPGNAHTKQGNPVVSCNALYKAEENFNCYLTPAQAISLARNLLQKAQLILDEKLEDAVVHMWNKGKSNEKLYCGLNQARKGLRKSGKKP
jgi:hypothetical protein